MNRYARLGFLLAALPIAACADSTPTPAPTAPAGPAPLAAADVTFINDAAQGGMAEIQAAQLVQKASHSPKVTSFAAKMISDHTANNDQLKQIATAKGATLPTAPSDAETQQITALQALHGHKLDHTYLADQIADHTQMLQAFQAEAANSTDPDLKKFASDSVPVIQSHLDMANAMTKGPMHKGAHHHHHHTAS